MKNFVVIMTFTYSYEYAVLKHLLEQEGINHFFENEVMANVFPFYSNALGGIHLRVHTNDVLLAREIIDSLQLHKHLKIV